VSTTTASNGRSGSAAGDETGPTPSVDATIVSPPPASNDAGDSVGTDGVDAASGGGFRVVAASLPPQPAANPMTISSEAEVMIDLFMSILSL
jgi:hypothetical protein